MRGKGTFKMHITYIIILLVIALEKTFFFLNNAKFHRTNCSKIFFISVTQNNDNNTRNSSTIPWEKIPLLSHTCTTRKSSAKVPIYLDCELLIDPLPSRKNCVSYDCLQLHYERCKMTHVCPLVIRHYRGVTMLATLP